MFQLEVRICGLRITNVIILGLRFISLKSKMTPFRAPAAKFLILARRRRGASSETKEREGKE